MFVSSLALAVFLSLTLSYFFRSPLNLLSTLDTNGKFCSFSTKPLRGLLKCKSLHVRVGPHLKGGVIDNILPVG